MTSPTPAEPVPRRIGIGASQRSTPLRRGLVAEWEAGVSRWRCRSASGQRWDGLFASCDLG
jgi:hypothetical protein